MILCLLYYSISHALVFNFLYLDLHNLSTFGSCKFLFWFMFHLYIFAFIPLYSFPDFSYKFSLIFLFAFVFLHFM